MTHIEAMKQGLEALEEAVHYTSAPVWSPSMTKECNEAITSLRQAIAEAEKQEPVIDKSAAIRIATALGWKPPAQPEPIQNLQCFHCQDTIETLNDKVMQLMAKRTWVGLTDEEILSDDTLRYYYGMNGGAGPVSQKGKKVIVAIEAKLKEKNGYAKENT